MKTYKLTFFIILTCIASCKKNNIKHNIPIVKNKDLKVSLIDKENKVLENSQAAFSPFDPLMGYYLKNDSINIELKFDKINSKQTKFNLKIFNLNKWEVINGLAELLLIEDLDGSMILPEGTGILDRTTKVEYFCDSTFMYNSDKINLSFGFETKTKKRLSLVIYNSTMNSIKDNDYTLYRKLRE